MAQFIPLVSRSAKENQAADSPSKQVRKLKIQLSDRTFQIKKLQEDYAQRRAHLELQFSQQKNALNSVIKGLKAKAAEDNEDWADKIQQLRRQNQSSLKANDEKWAMVLQEQVLKRIQAEKVSYEQQIKNLQETVEKLELAMKAKQRQFQQNLHKIQHQHKTTLEQFRAAKEAEISEIVEKMTRDQDMKINALMHARNQEEKSHAFTKNLLARRDSEYLQLQKLHEKLAEQKDKQIFDLKKQLQILADRCSHKQAELQKLSQKTKNSIIMTAKQYEQKMLRNEQQWQQSMESLNQKWRSQHKRVQSAYEKAYSACMEKQKLWEQRGNKILQFYQKKEPREEDMKLIEQLEVKLIRKQFELEREKQQLKSCKLELENMDDIYKRVFVSAQKSNRNSNSFQLKKMKLPGLNTKPINTTVAPKLNDSYF